MCVCNAVAMFELFCRDELGRRAGVGQFSMYHSQKKRDLTSINYNCPLNHDLYINQTFPYILTLPPKKKKTCLPNDAVVYHTTIYRCRHYDGICDPLPVALELSSPGGLSGAQCR